MQKHGGEKRRIKDAVLSAPGLMTFTEKTGAD